MKKFPVAIQIYSVRDDAQANLFGTLKKLKEMGYDEKKVPQWQHIRYRVLIILR